MLKVTLSMTTTFASGQCQWTDKSFQAQADQEIYVGEDDEPTRLIEGDWYCRGIWLTKLPWAKNWWTMDGRECLVRMQQVLHSSLPLVERSESNPFRSGVPSTTVDHANEHGAWLMSEDDHSYMVMRRRQVDGMDYPDGVLLTWYPGPIWKIMKLKLAMTMI